MLLDTSGFLLPWLPGSLPLPSANFTHPASHHQVAFLVFYNYLYTQFFNLSYFFPLWQHSLLRIWHSFFENPSQREMNSHTKKMVPLSQLPNTLSRPAMYPLTFLSRWLSALTRRMSGQKKDACCPYILLDILAVGTNEFSHRCLGRLHAKRGLACSVSRTRPDQTSLICLKVLAPGSSLYL